MEEGGRGGHQASSRARGAALAEVWKREAAADTRRTAAAFRVKKSTRMNPANPAANKQQRRLKREAHRLNMELDLQRLFGLLSTALLIG